MQIGEGCLNGLWLDSYPKFYWLVFENVLHIEYVPKKGKYWVKTCPDDEILTC